MTARDDKNIKNILLNEFGRDYIEGLAYYLHEAAKKFIENRQLSNYIHLDDDLTIQCLLDTLFDLQRLRHFHNISQENLIKIHSYLAYWWIRRKPFQRLPKSNNIGLFANELFAGKFLLSALPNDISDSNKYDQIRANESSAYLQYHLKYRNLNPQTLELFLVGLETAK